MSIFPPPLGALAARAQLGDRGALEVLLRALQPGLRSHLRVLVQEPSDADDALQETLWIIARRIGTLHHTSLMRAWAYRIATREALHLLRRARRNQSEELTEAELVTFSESDVSDMIPDTQAEVLDYLDQLPSKAQVVVRLRFVDGLSQHEIAAALEIPLGTVKSRLAYGLQRLRELLRPHASAAAMDGAPIEGARAP